MKNPKSSTNAVPAYTVKSLVKALNILQLLADEEPPYTLTQLSRRLHLHVSTVHRLLVNLVRQGFVEEDPFSGGYKISYRVLRMGLRVLDRLDFRRAAHPLLRELNRHTLETVHLAILQEARAISIEKFDSPLPVGLDARLGGIMPLHCTGTGKTLLAYAGEDLFNQVAQAPGLPRMTAHTLTVLPQLRRELERIRQQGYAVDHEEAVEGLCCVAGPVFNHSGQIVAAFSVAGPATRFAPPRIAELAELVRETSRQISYRLGYRRGVQSPSGSGGGSSFPNRDGARAQAERRTARLREPMGA